MPPKNTNRQTVITAQSALDTLSPVIATEGFENLALVVTTSAGVSAGAVQVEGAATSTFAGTWVIVITPLTANAATTTFENRLGPRALLPFIRARISTAITGGTIDAMIVLN